MGQIGPAGETAIEYLKRMPNASTRAIARSLVNDEPRLFKNIQYAINTVRYHRGERNPKAGSKYKEPLRTKEERARLCAIGNGIPKPVESTVRYINLPDAKHWLVLSDVHIPFHNQRAVETAINWALRRQYRFDGILFLGDLIDCYSCSHFMKDPRLIDFEAEVEKTHDFIDAIEHTFKPKHIVWKEGNHEQRLKNYFMSQAPLLFQLDPKMATLRKLCRFTKSHHHYLPTEHFLKHKELNIVHGHEFDKGFAAPVNIARGTYMRLKECGIQGHHHKSDSHVETTISGKIISTWSLGCLCDLRPGYRPINNWNHGFAALHTGVSWQVENHKIYNSKVV